MNAFVMESGAVFKVDWSPEPVRVLAFDVHVVMYDAWWPHKGAWGMSKLLGKYSYYRLQRNYFEEHASFLSLEPLSEREVQVHRPNLPFSFGVSQSLSWYERWPNDLRIESEYVLHSPAVYISPFGPRDSSKPAVLVHATNGQSFTAPELLIASKQIQDTHIRELPLTSGVGIHRLGIQKRLPSYYLWGAKSRLEAS